MISAERIRDLVIVGAGDVGTAIARELSHFRLELALIEAGCDVGAGTSKANTAILHTGFDANPGSLEACLVARGHELLSRYAAEVGIPLERTGAVLVAWNEQQRAQLPCIVERARTNGYHRVRELAAEDLYHLEPNLGPGAVAALEVPDEHIVCPFTPPLAYATEAVLGGSELLLNTRLLAADRLEDTTLLLRTSSGALRTRWLININAAGLHSDEVDRMLGHARFTVIPRRGEFIVFDKLTRPLLSHAILPVPSRRTKGVVIAPTVFGSVVLGPTAKDIKRKDDPSSTKDGIDSLMAQGERIMPALVRAEVTAVYAGLRAATEHSDYQIYVHPEQRYVCVGGIRSTGLTASMAIAEHVRTQLIDAGLELEEQPARPRSRMPNLGESFPRPYAAAERIASNPDYGRIVCFCERVTRGEIVDALNSPIPPADLDGLRRRSRALMGRCQGFFCAAHLTALLAHATGRKTGELHGAEDSADPASKGPTAGELRGEHS